MKLPVTHTTIQARYSDTDAMGHMSSGSYITFMEVGRTDFFKQIHAISDHEQSFVVVNMNVDIINECHYGQALTVTSWCSRVGKKSLTVCNDIFADGSLVAKGSVTTVAFDSETRTSAALPAGWEVSDYQPSTHGSGQQ